jgi:hypothetical protein
VDVAAPEGASVESSYGKPGYAAAASGRRRFEGTREVQQALEEIRRLFARYREIARDAVTEHDEQAEEPEEALAAR